MGKRYVSIVGTIVSGRSSDSSWFGKLCGASTVLDQIGSSGDIEVYINSPGGSVFAGFEIVNAFNAAVQAGRSVTMYVSPLAASAASYISSGVKGATVVMTSNAKLMFHAPWTCVCGSKGELQDAHDLLGKLEDDIRDAVRSRGALFDESWFDTGRAKFFSAKESVEMKLADHIGDPPSELVSFISEDSAKIDSTWDKGDKEVAARTRTDDFESYAAGIEFQGYLQHLCDEHYGETTQVKDVSDDTFKVVRADGSVTLLKYVPDSLTIVSINWGSSSDKEKDMKVKDNSNVTPAAQVEPVTDVTEPIVEPVAQAEPVAEPAAQAEPEPTAEPVAEPVTEPAAQVEPVANTLGLTDDMVAFAKENYEQAREAHLVTIKASSENTFSDEELSGFSIKMLAKLAKLADTSARKSDGVDNSIVPSPKGSQGTGGSLPPPKF